MEIIPTNDRIPGDKYGQHTFGAILQKFKPEVVWTLADVYMVAYLSQARRQSNFNLVGWIPIDGSPTPRPYLGVLGAFDRLYAVSNFGADQMGHLLHREVPTIYHGVDVDVFKPAPEKTRQKLRAEAGEGLIGEDTLVMGFVGKNQFRKMPWLLVPLQYYLRSGHYLICGECKRITLGGYDRNKREPIPFNVNRCRWCKQLAVEEAAPLDVITWAHTFEADGGILFNREQETWQQEGRILFSHGLTHRTGYTDQQMVDLYTIFDIYLALSGGEGFNCCCAEAMACEVPVVYTDYSGQVEVASGGGLPVEASAWVVEHNSGIERYIPSIEDAVLQIRRLRLPDYRRPLGKLGRESVVDRFNLEKIAAQWNDELVRLKTHRVLGGKA